MRGWFQEGTEWSPEEISLLRRDWETVPTKEISGHLNRSVTALYTKASKLDLRKSKEIRRRSVQETLTLHHWARGQTKETHPGLARAAAAKRGRKNPEHGEKLRARWKDPTSGFHTPEFHLKRIEIGRESAKSPKHYFAGLTYRIPKGMRISRSTEMKKDDPRTKKLALKGRSKQTPRFQDTEIERIMQKALRYAGVSFTKHNWVEGSNPDLLLPEFRIAIFCDGDYWHNLPSYRLRDENVNRRLSAAGWVVLRFWEHEIKSDVGRCVARIKEVVNTRSSAFVAPPVAEEVPG